MNTHIYYHCNRVRDYDCEEPYITEEELIRQLITYLPKLKLNKRYLWNEFNEEIKRLTHLKGIISRQTTMDFELTPHNNRVVKSEELSVEEDLMLQDYLHHILQYGTPEERINILSGLLTRFELTNRHLRIVK